jgi:Ni,Fe-hydrogenase III small subunit
VWNPPRSFCISDGAAHVIITVLLRFRKEPRPHAHVSNPCPVLPQGLDASADRRNLILTAEYSLSADRTHRELRAVHRGSGNGEADIERIGQKACEKIQKLLRRSLAIREVDAGSCNGCELEIVALNNPVYDLERFGIQFVASPRHADMLLVTGPVTRNMELALLKTYRAMPEPRFVVAVGACGISGGIFGKNYASLGGVDKVVPVDVYIPGCPPRPQALLHGILLAIGRLGDKLFNDRRE